MSISFPPSTNHLIDGLPEATLQRWLPRLERFEVPKGLALHESGSLMGYAYFPTTAIVSLVYETGDGASTDACDGRQ